MLALVLFLSSFVISSILLFNPGALLLYTPPPDLSTET